MVVLNQLGQVHIQLHLDGKRRSCGSGSVGLRQMRVGTKGVIHYRLQRTNRCQSVKGGAGGGEGERDSVRSRRRRRFLSSSSCSSSFSSSSSPSTSWRRRAQGSGDDQEISEEVLQRLKQAEEEAAKLRKQLAKMKKTEDEGEITNTNTTDGDGSGVADANAAPPGGESLQGSEIREVVFDGKKVRYPRVDSTGSRENLLNLLYPQNNKQVDNDVWIDGLAETKQFFTGNSISESDYQSGVSEEDKPVVLRRLLIGLGLTIGGGLLGLIPTEKLDVTTPKQPLFAYLVQILEAKGQFASIEKDITYANYESAQRSVKSILGDPLQLKTNMKQVAKLTAEKDSQRAEKMRELTRDAVDYLSQVDYDEYFDTLIKPSGKQEMEFAQFSLDSLEACKKNLDMFLRLVDHDELEAAQNQLDSRNYFLNQQQQQQQQEEQPQEEQQQQEEEQEDALLVPSTTISATTEQGEEEDQAVPKPVPETAQEF